MVKYPEAIQNIINHFSKLPGIGPKTAERLVFYLLNQPKQDLENFAVGLKQLKNKVANCGQCHNFSESNPCLICGDTNRNKSVICVLAKPQDLLALEKTGQYQGVYHVLGGVIDSLEGISPEQLKIKELLERIKNNNVLEIILGFNSDMPGETTMLYLKKLFKQFNKLKVTRLAQGLPSGSDLEYADELTLGNALKSRKEV